MQSYPRRKQNRLSGYDYSASAVYFITICTANKQCVLSSIQQSNDDEPLQPVLTEIGSVVDSYIKSIPGICKYVIMPNHVHLLIHKTDGKSIASDIRSCKLLASKKLGRSIWQRSYYDRIVRNEEEYRAIWKYIDENPIRWSQDEYHQNAERQGSVIFEIK